ncbi:hypothetical protein GBA52_000753 [Prunus armeniaca]|nr:hypothetical protein GBA52_000753 [Prunus armeniaca]
MLLVDEAYDVVAFIESLATPAAVIDFFVICTFMAYLSDSATSVLPSTLLPPQPAGPPLHPQSTGPSLPPQPRLAPTTVAASLPRILIDSFYAELNAEGYKFAKPEHPPKVATALSKAGAMINLKILINNKDLNTAIAEDATRRWSSSSESLSPVVGSPMGV